jgi:polar amino acid transport system permease protein
MEADLEARRWSTRWWSQRGTFWRSPWRDILLFVLLIVAVVWLVSLSTARLGYTWQWYRVLRYLIARDSGRLVVGPLLKGLGFTLRIAGISLVLSLVLGLMTALIRLSDSLMGRLLTRIYLEVIRNTPLVVQVYLLYFVIGPVLGLGRVASAVFALSLFEGAYLSEIFRAGIVSLHRGQWEAAYSLGLSPFDTYRDVILPQAVRRVLPPLTGEVISLIKNTSLVSLVALGDLALQARVIATDTFLTFEIWFTTALIYLAITVPLSLIENVLARRHRVLT